jgi:hypothetical protein
MDIRQTSEYANYLKLLGWEIAKVKQGQIFIKKFPVIGSIVKVQRIASPIPFAEIEKIAKKYRAFQILIDQELPQNSPLPTPPSTYKTNKTPFVPTKTIVLDIDKTEEKILESFSKNKRRDVRSVLRGNLIIKEESGKEYIDLKKKILLEKFILPIGTALEIQPLYQAFSLEKIKILIAYHQNQPVAGTIILFQPPMAYYWLATATKEGKKLLAPTLLIWKAIKIAKQKGCKKLDLEGVYDDRFPKTKNQLGYSKFKEGFGGKEIIYPPTLIKTKFFF